MNAEQVRKIRIQMDMSQEQFAELLGVTRRTVGNWERGGPIAPVSEHRLKELEEVLAAGSKSADEELSLRDEVSQLKDRVDYLEAIVLKNRVDELEELRRRKGLSALPTELDAVADSHTDADDEVEGSQETP